MSEDQLKRILDEIHEINVHLQKKMSQLMEATGKSVGDTVAAAQGVRIDLGEITKKQDETNKILRSILSVLSKR